MKWVSITNENDEDELMNEFKAWASLVGCSQETGWSGSAEEPYI